MQDTDTLHTALAKQGLLGGLAVLNSRVEHRFTGVYRLDDGVMRNVALIDKVGEVVPEALLAVPLGDSFCQFVLRDGNFLTRQSGSDRRLDGHTYQGVLQSYVGLPVSADDHQLIGTLCHFDFDEREIEPAEFDFLTKAVKLLPPYVR